MVTNTNKLMAWPWVLKWDPATQIFSLVLSNISILVNTTAPKPELNGRYIDDCIGATSSTREELTQCITAINSFHPALKYTWEISDSSLAFLDIKISIEGNGLRTSVLLQTYSFRPFLSSRQFGKPQNTTKKFIFQIGT